MGRFIYGAITAGFFVLAFFTLLWAFGIGATDTLKGVGVALGLSIYYTSATEFAVLMAGHEGKFDPPQNPDDLRPA